ncbi:MAG: hypothetical protein Q8P67_03215 [archaeon]|nr:hypothetical protein [archaeon]
MLKSLWKITAVVYGTLLLSGEVLKWALGCSRLTVPLSYGFGMVAFYLWHMMAHKNIRVWPLSSVHAAHMDHHWRIYPPTSAKFLSTKPLHSLAGIRARPQWVPKWFPDIEHEMVLILMIAFNQFALGPFVFSASFAECFSGFCLCMIAGGIMGLFLHPAFKNSF